MYAFIMETTSDCPLSRRYSCRERYHCWYDSKKRRSSRHVAIRRCQRVTV